MYRVDITADLNDEDHSGYVWTFLDEARDPAQITPGALVVAGDEDAAAHRFADPGAACDAADDRPGTVPV
jgi:hypothetical protein